MNLSETDSNTEVTVTIREATPEDASGIIAVQHDTWLATYPNEEHGITKEHIEARDWYSEARLQRWREGLTPNSTKYTWVAEENGKIVGFCVGKKDEKENRLKAIYILPEAQGKKIGKRLAEACLAWLGEDKDVVLDVVTYNAQAIGFYKKLGFEGNEPVPEEEVVAPVGGKKFPEIRMRKSFSQNT